MSFPFLVILVPVSFGFMGFALDLGRLYLIRGELNQAANAMALAAAAQLNGTVAALGNATTAAQQSLDDSNGFANKYNFGGLPIGQTTGNLTSTVNPPAYFDTLANALSGSGNQADGTTARHAQISITADAPLLFWSFLSVAQSRKTSVAAMATAGISAPVCTACGIAPFAVAPLDPTDSINFGFGDPSAGQLFTLAFSCSGTPAPTPLPGTGQVIRYVIINRYDSGNATLDETQQLYRDGAGGLLASADPNPTGSAVPLACVGINDASETIWAGATPVACSAAAPVSVVEALCGLYSRFDNASTPGNCATDITDFADLSAQFLPDTDVTTGQADLYTAYTGNGRRVITVPIVNTLAANASATMLVLGFRQFFLEPNLDGTFFNPTDPNGRFVVEYIGNPAPVTQGYVDDRFQLGCPAPVASGPGKVVLHQ